MKRLPRRRLLAGATAAGLLAAFPARPWAAVVPAAAAPSPDAQARRSAHFPFGPVFPPRPMPAWPVVTQLGVGTDLCRLLRGRVTALQLMFTGCSATCPIEGALFAQAQRDLPPGAQLLSVSIDPLSDTPAALAGWLRRFGARPGWTAVVPRPPDLDALVELLTAGGEPRPSNDRDPHTGQVFLFDPRADLVLRLASMPSAAAIVAALAALARRG